MRYYTIKEGSRQVNGFAIRVNPEADLDKRVEVLTKDDARFVPVPSQGDAIYNVYSGENRLGRITIAESGEMRLLETHTDVPVYIDQITKAEARKLEEGAANWALLQAWVATDAVTPYPRTSSDIIGHPPA